MRPRIRGGGAWSQRTGVEGFAGGWSMSHFERSKQSFIRGVTGKCKASSQPAQHDATSGNVTAVNKILQPGQITMNKPSSATFMMVSIILKVVCWKPLLCFLRCSLHLCKKQLGKVSDGASWFISGCRSWRFNLLCFQN